MKRRVYVALILAAICAGAFIGFRRTEFRDHQSSAVYRQSFIVLPFDIAIPLQPFSPRTPPFKQWSYDATTYTQYGFYVTELSPFSNATE